MQQIVIVGNDDDDWEGLYVDGTLLREGHSLSVRDVLDALGVTHEHRLCDHSWLSDCGNLPDDIQQVRWAK